MKRRLFAIVWIVIILAPLGFAQKPSEFAINYRSELGEYELNLVKYLGESSEGYEHNTVQNINIVINDEGVAYISPIGDWVGTEVILFRKLGTVKGLDLNGTGGGFKNDTNGRNSTFYTKNPEFEIAKGFELPQNIEIINNNLMNQTLSALLDGSFAELITDIKKEELVTIKKSRSEEDIQLQINDEISIFLKDDSSPDFKINLNLGGQKDIIVPDEDEKNFSSKFKSYFIFGFLILIIILFFVIRYNKTKHTLHDYKWKIPVLKDKEITRRKGEGIVSSHEEAQEKIKKILKRKR